MTSLASSASISARLDRLPASRPLWSWVARISFGGFFEVYETALTTLLAPALKHAGIFHTGRDGLFGLPDLATFAFATFGGLFLGALLFSAVADRVGRRPVFTYALLAYAAATLVMAFQHDAASICLWRFVAAVGVGAETVAVDAYLSEMLPKSIRGRGFAVSKSIQYCSVPIAGILAALVASKTVGGMAGWRIMLFLPLIGAALIWWVRRGLPESPRWLAEHGRQDRADEIVSEVERRIETAVGRTLPTPVAATDAVQVVKGSFLDLFRGDLLRRTVVITVVSCAVTIAYFGFSNWLPTLLEKRGVTISKSLLYTALIALSFPLAPFLFSRLADRFERKLQIAVGAGVVVVAGLAFAAQSTMTGWLLCGLVIGLASNLAAYSTHTYRSELFPTAVRGRAIGFVYSIDRLTAAFNSYLVGFILVKGGVTGVLVFITLAAFVAMAVALLAGPRTRGRSPDEIGADRVAAITAAGSELVG